MEEQDKTKIEREIKDQLMYIIRNIDSLSINEILNQIRKNIDSIKKLGKFNKIYLQLINDIHENVKKDIIMKKIIEILNNSTNTNENCMEEIRMIPRSQTKIRNDNKFDFQQMQKRKTSLDEVNIILLKN